MDYQSLINLSFSLEDLGMDQEAGLLSQMVKIAQGITPQEVESWKAVVEEVDRPYETEAMKAISGPFVKGWKELAKHSGVLGKAKKEDIIDAVEYVKKFFKLAEENNELIIKPRPIAPGLESQAIGWSLLGKALPGLPGAIIGGLFALKNIVYSVREFSRMVQSGRQIGLNWWNTLQTSDLHEAAVRYGDDPKKLFILTKTTKAAQLFKDEAISAAINSIDATKDLIMGVLEALGTLASLGIGGGLALTIDIGISIALMFVEWVIEDEALKGNKEILKFIRKTALSHIPEESRELTEEEKLEQLKALFSTLPSYEVPNPAATAPGPEPMTEAAPA